MGCCDQEQPKNEKNNSRHSGHGGIKHMLMMLACCLVPLALVLILKQSGYNGAAGYLILLVCPLLHLFMMRGMFRKKKTIDEKQSG